MPHFLSIYILSLYLSANSQFIASECGLVFLICDCPQGAVQEMTLRESLGLKQTTGKKAAPQKGTRPIEVFMCSVIKRTGFSEGFQWLSLFIE